jgi:replicative DNA helicase
MMSNIFDSCSGVCYCHKAGLCGKPRRGNCFHRIDGDLCPLEYEMALLGAVILDAECLDRVSDLIGPKHFVWPGHAKIYQIFHDLIRAGKWTLETSLETAAHLFDQTGGMPIEIYLRHLMVEAGTIITAREFASCMIERVAQASLKEAA